MYQFVLVPLHCSFVLRMFLFTAWAVYPKIRGRVLKLKVECRLQTARLLVWNIRVILKYALPVERILRYSLPVLYTFKYASRWNLY